MSEKAASSSAAEERSKTKAVKQEGKEQGGDGAKGETVEENRETNQMSRAAESAMLLSNLEALLGGTEATARNAAPAPTAARTEPSAAARAPLPGTFDLFSLLTKATGMMTPGDRALAPNDPNNLLPTPFAPGENANVLRQQSEQGDAKAAAAVKPAAVAPAPAALTRPSAPPGTGLPPDILQQLLATPYGGAPATSVPSALLPSLAAATALRGAGFAPGSAVGIGATPVAHLGLAGLSPALVPILARPAAPPTAARLHPGLAELAGVGVPPALNSAAAAAAMGGHRPWGGMPIVHSGLPLGQAGLAAPGMIPGLPPGFNLGALPGFPAVLNPAAAALVPGLAGIPSSQSVASTMPPLTAGEAAMALSIGLPPGTRGPSVAGGIGVPMAGAGLYNIPGASSVFASAEMFSDVTNASDSAPKRGVKRKEKSQADAAANGETLIKSREARWIIRYNELHAFSNEHGHCRVPHGYAPNPKLSWWVMNQRAQYAHRGQGKKTWLTDERIKLLNDIGEVNAESIHQLILA
ncbi:hypothetical protein ACHAWF_011927 [Thalassiosira exigua]